MSKYQLMPVEPTRKMWAAAGDAVITLSSNHHDAITDAVYKSLLAAAPKFEREHPGRVRCNQCMWIGDEGELLAVRNDHVQQCPACYADDGTLMDFPSPAVQREYPPCDYCGITPDHHPWHGSGVFNGEDSPHIHACNDCRHKLPNSQTALQQRDSLIDALTPQILDWIRCGLAANGRLKDGSHPALEKLRDAMQACKQGGRL